MGEKNKEIDYVFVCGEKKGRTGKKRSNKYGPPVKWKHGITTGGCLEPLGRNEGKLKIVD